MFLWRRNQNKNLKSWISDNKLSNNQPSRVMNLYTNKISTFPWGDVTPYGVRFKALPIGNVYKLAQRGTVRAKCFSCPISKQPGSRSWNLKALPWIGNIYTPAQKGTVRTKCFSCQISKQPGTRCSHLTSISQVWWSRF